MKRAALILALASCGDDDFAWDKHQVRELRSKAAAAEEKKDFDGAVDLYRQALALAEKHEKLQAERSALRQCIDEALRAKADHDQAKADGEALIRDHEAHAYPNTKDGIREFLDRAKRVLQTCDVLGIAKRRIAQIVEAVDKEYEGKLREGDDDTISGHRKRVARDFLQKGKEDFPGAIAEWKSVIERTANPDVRRRGPEEIEKVHQLAFEAWHDLRFRAIELDDPKAAAEFLRKQLPRFRGCRFKDVDLEDAMLERIQELEK